MKIAININYKQTTNINTKKKSIVIVLLEFTQQSDFINV